MKRFFCAIFLLIATLSCGSKKQLDEIVAASFVVVKMQLTGTPSEKVYGAQIQSFTVQISNCSTSNANQTFTVNNEKLEKLWNLYEGDTGCHASLVSFEYGPIGAARTYRPSQGGVFTGVTGDSVSFDAGPDSTILQVSIGKQLRSRLERKESVGFYAMPAFGTTIENIQSEPTDFPNSDGINPLLKLTAVADGGSYNNEGGRGLFLVIECEKPIEFTKCDSHELLNYRFRVVEKYATPPTRQTLFDAMNTQQVIRPTLTHLFRNGLKFLALPPVPIEVTPRPELGIIIQFGSAYRYQEFSIDAVKYQ